MNVNNYHRKEVLQAIEYSKNVWTKYSNNEIDQLNYLEQMGNRFQGKTIEVINFKKYTKNTLIKNDKIEKFELFVTYTTQYNTQKIQESGLFFYDLNL
jgi:hypothetical protein